MRPGAAIVPGERYDAVAIAFHWTIAALVLTNVALAWFGDALAALVPPMPTHKAIGITVLFLTVGRLGWRLSHRMPPPPETLSRPAQRFARATHLAFYVLLLALPLTGWMLSSGTETRRPLTWFGLFDIPYLPVGLAAGDAAHAAHERLGPLMVALVVLHAAAALRHHFLLRDSTLARMLPWLARRA